MSLEKEQTGKSMEQNRKPRNKTVINGERIVFFSINDARTIGHP